MIPYDDLVAALSSWRARQGLPSGQLAGAASVPAPAAKPAQAAPAPVPAGRSGPTAAAAPAARPAAMVMDSGHEDAFDMEESALLEDAAFDHELAAAFDPAVESGEATSIGSPPTPSPSRSAPPPRRGGR